MAYETTFPKEHPRLNSCTESVNICPGWKLTGCINGGDEVDKPGGICPADQQAEKEFYQEDLWERDRMEADDGSQYRHLVDERENLELRAVRDSQIPLVMALGRVAA